jgi:hypothetical protein
VVAGAGIGSTIALRTGVELADRIHPAELAVRCAQTIPNATLAATAISNELSHAADYARAVAPRIVDFIEHGLR